MHLPYPKRKSSNAPPFLPRGTGTGSSSYSFGRGFSIPRRYRQQGLAVAALVLIGLIWLLTRGGGGSYSSRAGGGRSGMANHFPAGKPPTVIVTVVDEGRFGTKYTELVKENRKLYADRHGYETFFPNTGDYDLKGAPKSWAKVVALRHALTTFPEATYFWYVDIDTFIMNPQISIDKDIMAPAKLEQAMIVDYPVVPPDSIIHTFKHLHGQDVDLVVTQDKDGLSTSSFLIRNSEWSRFFLETWFDPIYRSYNFQKAETHALEHIVQWHPTILSKLALVPQRIINSYDKPDKGHPYSTGDLAVRFPKCAKSVKSPNCATLAEPFTSVWRSAYRLQ
ncbi:putative alpha-1,2-galactosyltransferase C8D2.17 [Cytospora mali]|uniref:Alpha-1,2-galactosyltransferase C8D2.17 n=1 Tax=Cytospora mali TaxID=578113 RepID=A0A194WCA4_CYTMA|nr:putative alpha-1,2-galactosyltransferase C8D2.17 [Valsa mali]